MSNAQQDFSSSKEIVFDLANKVDPSDSINSDDELKNKRSQLYNDILSDYQKSIQNTLKSKVWYKVITYIVVVLIMLSITATMICLLFIYSSLEMTEWLAVVIPLMISFLTVFIVLPKIITNYVFDKDEENHMLQLLKTLIEHDKE